MVGGVTLQARPLAARLRCWRSPPGQPPWARPALLAIAAAAGLAYGWGAGSAVLEAFYGAAARSMSSSWHDFAFGAFDPRGTVTVDKLPGALWVQALFMRLVGFHIWAVVAPQVIEGVLTVLVLYRAVRRLAGPQAGIVAAGVLATSPVTVALNRGNVADSLLILLTVLAADATSAALLSGRLRSLVLAGVWVGLAFQAKMLQAWLILPALALTYAVAAPAPLRTRLHQLLIAGAVTVAVSLSWMSAVSLVPAHDRPYVDGTRNDSLFSQVFDYNGVAHLGGNAFAGTGPPPAFLVKLVHLGSAVTNPARNVPPSWHRLLSGVLGRDDGWLLPAAVLAACAVLLTWARGAAKDRRDPLLACVLLWGTWLLVLAVFFSAGAYVNSYYVAALSPAIAGLCGAGVALLLEQRRHPSGYVVLAATLVASVGYDSYLLSGGSGVPGWLIPAGACLGIGGALALLVARRGAGELGTWAIALTVACICLLPAITAALVAHRRLGPFAAPYEPASATVSVASERKARRLDEQIVAQVSSAFKTPIVFATYTSILAAPYILATGREVLPIGGYQGADPAPGVGELRDYIASGLVRGFIVPPTSPDPRVAWIVANCRRPSQTAHAGVIALYECPGG